MAMVWLHGGKPPKVRTLVKWSAVYHGDAECPVHVADYPEGQIQWYGSGRYVVKLTELPIVVRMPILLVRGRIHHGVDILRRRELSMALRKITQQAGSATGGGPGCADMATWPGILEYLQTTAYPDGLAREPSCLIIVADGSGWRGCLSDKDNQRTLWKTAATIEDLLLMIETALQEDDPAAWRQSSAAKFKGKKRG